MDDPILEHLDDITSLGLNSDAVRDYFSNPEPSEADYRKVRTTLQFADKGTRRLSALNQHTRNTLKVAESLGKSGTELEPVWGRLQGGVQRKKVGSGKARKTKRR